MPPERHHSHRAWALSGSVRLSRFIQERYCFEEAVGACGDGAKVFHAAGVVGAASGIVTSRKACGDLVAMSVEAKGNDRMRDRAPLVLAEPRRSNHPTDQSTEESP